MEIKFLSGYKTYIVALLLILWTIWAGATNQIDGGKIVELVLLALSIAGLRSGVAGLKG